MPSYDNIPDDEEEWLKSVARLADFQATTMFNSRKHLGLINISKDQLFIAYFKQLLYDRQNED